jgi:valacyclovir hydrolase
MPFIDISTGANLYYDDAGSKDGPTLIAVHGRLGTGRIDLGNVIDWFAAEGYHVLAPTLRGYGQSSPKPRDFPIDFYRRDALDVLAFMDALNIEKAHLFGYSDGGEMALIAAGLAPERFRSVMTVGAVGYFGPEILPVVERNYPGTWLGAEPDLMAVHHITDADAFALAWVDAMKHYINTGGDISLSLAPNISAPLLLMLGRKDTLNPEAYGQRVVDLAQRGTLVMFDTGHGIHDEAPDEFKRLLSEFLRAVESDK